MPPFRPSTPPPDRRTTAALFARLTAGQRVSNSPADLISDVGGTREAARLLGKSQRTLQRRAAGQVGLTAAERGVLARAGQAARTSRIIEELGGAHRVAELTGRNVSTVRRWARGQIRTPKADAQKTLKRADGALRLRDKGLSVDPSTGFPTKPVFLQMNADVRVRGASKSLDYPTTGKNIGAQGKGVLFDADTIQAIAEALGNGDSSVALAEVESYLSTNYAACTSYDPSQGIGFFIDRIESVDFHH